MMKISRILLSLIFGCSGCLGRSQLPFEQIPLLSGSTLMGYPQVTNLAISPLKEGEIFLFVLTFSMPMDRESVENALSLRRATEPVLTGREGNPIPLKREEFQWNEELTELAFSVAITGSDPVILVLTPECRGKNRKPLDGTGGPLSGYDPRGFHRLEEDGFSGPSTYISLPFFPQGSTALTGHPSYLLSQSRPLLACYPQGSRSLSPVTGGDLGFFPTSRIEIPCTLWDRRLIPENSMGYYRRSLRSWDPDALPQGEFLSQGGTIPAETRVGYGVRLTSSHAKVLAYEGPTALRWQGTIEKIEEDTGTLYLAPAFEPEPLFPVTSFSENLLLFSPVRYTISPVFSRPLERKMVDPEGTFLSGELLGDTLKVGSDPNYRGKIVAHTASEIIADSITPCGFECGISIELDITAHFAIGEGARIVSPDLTFIPKEDLPSGTWSLRVSGGKDLFGIPRTDGIRNGDEALGIPDDDQVFTFTVP